MQEWRPIELDAQSVSFASVPVHPTLSSHILPSPSPNLAPKPSAPGIKSMLGSTPSVIKDIKHARRGEGLQPWYVKDQEELRSQMLRYHADNNP